MDKQQGPRVNEAIRVREVRVINDTTGEQLGIMLTFRALELAQSQGLDLVEVADTARPPVCKIMDYGAYKFKKAKAAREAKKAQVKTEVKEMRLTAHTQDHDLQVKARKIKEFLEDNSRVVVSILFKGREKAHLELGRTAMTKLVGFVGEIAKVESMPKTESAEGDKIKMVMVLVPQRQ